MASTAELTLSTPYVGIVAGALSPELAERIPRTKIEVVSLENRVLIRIEAEDQNALRAALNSYIRWANVAEETAKETRA